MPSLDDFKPDSRHVMLFVGESGTGKSGAAASFPEPFHELDFDNRFGGVWQLAQRKILKNTKVTYQPFNVMGGWEPVSKELSRIQINAAAYRQNPQMITFPYKTIECAGLGSLERLITQLALKQMPGHQKLGDGEHALLLGAPGDVKAAGNGLNQILDHLFSLPCNVIVTCHIVEKWGKPKQINDEDKYKPSEVIGERINLSPNIAAGVAGRFDNVFKFQMRLVGNKVIYEVIFSDGDIAKNSFGVPPGVFDFTGKSFYEFFQETIKKYV